MLVGATQAVCKRLREQCSEQQRFSLNVSEVAQLKSAELGWNSSASFLRAL